MLITWLVAAALWLAGASLYMGRRHWRFSWDRLLLASVILQAAGIVLIAPPFQDFLSAWANQATGMALLPDFLGGICFVAACDTTILAVAYRLMSKPYRLRGYVEQPSAVVSALMLLTFMLSQSTHRDHCNDFFSCPMDLWLRAYWVLFGGIGTYLVCLLFYILLAIRRVYPESRRVVDLYLAASVIGSVTGGAIFVHGLMGAQINPLWMWVPLCIACGLSFIAGSWSWRRNRV